MLKGNFVYLEQGYLYDLSKFQLKLIADFILPKAFLFNEILIVDENLIF